MNTARQQSGVVLIMTLVILLVVTLLGTSSIQMTGILEKMSRNATDSASAMGAAEAALRAAELVVEAETGPTGYDQLAAGVPVADSAVDNGKYNIPANTITPRWRDAAMWQGSRSTPVAYSGSAAGTQPRYFIERIKAVLSEEDRLNLDNVGGGTGADRTYIFRITALGTGKTTAAQVYLQGTYGKKF
jgi:type IV pilus assembly protein PilX